MEMQQPASVSPDSTTQEQPQTSNPLPAPTQSAESVEPTEITPSLPVSANEDQISQDAPESNKEVSESDQAQSDYYNAVEKEAEELLDLLEKESKAETDTSAKQDLPGDGNSSDNSSNENSLSDLPPKSNVSEEQKQTNSNDKTKTTDPLNCLDSTQAADSKKSSKQMSKKSKKKEDKSIDHILRALSSLQTTEEKLAALCKKYADLHEEQRSTQAAMKQMQRKLTMVVREKEQLQTEHTKTVIAKSRLENLCRELQKHNKLIKEESIARVREEDEKRKEISAKFQNTIGEIQAQMQDNHDRNKKLREENAELAGKLKQFIDQYEVREKQLEKLMKHRELENQLSDAKLQQAAVILKEEQERNKKEKEILVLQASESLKKSTLVEAQLSMYKERYEEFQKTINRSNDMFQKFKTEMDKMSKRIKKLEKEGASWKSKWESSNKALIDMAEDKQKYDKEKLSLLSKINKLESLCRALQAERNEKKSGVENGGPGISITDKSGSRETSTPPNTPENSSEKSPDSPVENPPSETSNNNKEKSEGVETSPENAVEVCSCTTDEKSPDQPEIPVDIQPAVAVPVDNSIAIES